MSTTQLPTCTLGLRGETLSAWEADLLPEAEARRLAEHVPTCPACQRALQPLRQIGDALRAVPVPGSGELLWQHVRRAQADGGHRRPRRQLIRPLSTLRGFGALAAALLVVVLMAGTLLTHYWGQRMLGGATATVTASVTAPTVSPTSTSGGTQRGPCTPKQIKVNLPARATIFTLTMTSPTEGWLVGAIFNADFMTTQAGMILHFSHCQWQPVRDPLPNAFLDGISMVSPTEGWVTGYTSSGDNYLLHYAHGHWQQVTAPYQATDGSYFGGIKMLSPDEGWLVVNSKSSFQPPIWSLLLHYQHGTWSRVTVPIPTVWDFAPVGPDELWIVGNSSTAIRHDSTLAHYRAGQWTTTPAPGHVLLNALLLLSPTDGYAIGWQPQPTNGNPVPPPPAAVLQFDGAVWKPIQTGANVAAQTVVLFDHTDGWAFVQPPSSAGPSNPPIASAQHEVGGHWQNVPWPFTDAIDIGTVVRASAGEYWANVFFQIGPPTLGDFHWGLLHYVQGTWTAYGLP